MYTFRYETGKGGTDIDFVDVESITGTGKIEIINASGGRTQLLKMSKSDADLASFEHTGFDITTTGVIEFLFREITEGDDFYLKLYDGATRLIQFQLDTSEDKWNYDNGGGWTQIYYPAATYKFYIIRIDIDIDAGVNGQFSFYIYDDSYTVLGSVTDIEFENNATTVDEAHFSLGTVGLATLYLLDCFGITGEGSYIVGDIQNAEVDVSNYLENTRIHDGIIPYKKFFMFDVHPNYHTYFVEGYYIDVFDDSDNLLFTGYIKTKSQDNAGIYKLSCQGMANEIFERTYDKSFSSDKTSEKLQDIIDNKLEFCYRDSSIKATTIDYSYEYNRACIYMFNLARYLGRQVLYIEPDGKVWSKDYDDLVKQSEYYLGTYNFRDDADGTSGTDIDFIDSATLYNGACEIVSDWQSHKKVLRLTDDATAGEDPHYIHNITQATSGTHEFWIGTNNVTEYWEIRYMEDATTNINLRITDSAFDYYSGAAWVEICTMANDTFYHIKIVWRADNKFDVYVNDIKEVDDIAMPANMSSGINKVRNRGVGDSTDYLYLDAYGETEDTSYNVEDNLLAGWYLYDGNQNALLIDIPGLQDSIPGYYFGNTGITSVSIRYKDNINIIRPATPVETFIKKRLKEFRDPKLQASTEANQLGDNLYNIFSTDTIFLGLLIKGKGWLQPGKVIAIINTNQIAITAEAFLILKFIYDPKNDVYINMILSNNIITPDEFKSDLDTSSQQIHTAILQSFENQANIGCYWEAKNVAYPCTEDNTNRTIDCGAAITHDYDKVVSVYFELKHWGTALDDFMIFWADGGFVYTIEPIVINKNHYLTAVLPCTSDKFFDYNCDIGSTSIITLIGYIYKA